MDYIVSEKDLKELVDGYYTFSGQPVYKWVDDFLKSKQPVEEIKPMCPSGEAIKIDFSKYKIFIQAVSK